MRTLVVIPSRYEPERLRKLVDGIDEPVLVLDNGHESPLEERPGMSVLDLRGRGIYAMWNRGVTWAREHGYDVVVLLNDDARPAKGVIARMAEALADPTVGITYPGTETVSAAAGPYQMTGYCFAFRTDIGIAFDETWEWWCGDTAFERDVLRAGLTVKGVPGKVQHRSDSERDDWARRPDLKEAVERDKARWQATIVRTVILVPRRANPERDLLWQWCRNRWATYFPDIPIYEGHHDDGPFNRSAAINRAATAADDGGRWDLAIVIDADIFLRVSQVRAALERALETGKVTWAHRRWRGVREDFTKRICADRREFGPEVDHDDMDVLVERTNPISWSCCVVIPRGAWDDLGGFDERFKGWGFEDMAFQSAVVGLYGHERIQGDVYHLWHSRPFGTGRADKAGSSYTAEAITNARLGRRYMVAVRRDYGLTDRQEPSDAAELERDIANLVRDDRALTHDAMRLKLPDWSDWWPSLDELVAGAKSYRTLQARGVTVVVHTGGDLAMWPERSEYLRRSLASLSANVSGPIVQRVIYSDWGPNVLEELNAIGQPHGFYVAGDGHHGYTGSMARMWKYLAKRAKGEFIFQAEDDFIYDRPVDLEPMIDTLNTEPDIAQLALLRGPYYQRELEAGGVLQSLATPTELQNHRPHPFVTHRDHFTANPSLFRRSLTSKPWPSGKSSERLFGDALLRDPRTRFAYWGAGEAWISHIGAVRAGSSY